MEPIDPQRRSNAKVWWALALTMVPGLLAATGSETAVGLAFWTWPFASLLAGAFLGRHTGKPDGSDVLHGIGWAIGCGICSFGLQLAGCSISGYQPNFH